MLVNIKNGGLTAAIQTQGAELRSLRDAQGTEYIWQADPEYWDESAPWLFPVVCDLRNNHTIIGGKRYNMERHGFARKLAYAPASNGPSSATLQAKASAETLAQYPFRFALTQTFSLTDKALEIRTTVANEGPDEMLYCLGVHPGFRCPLYEGERFEDYRLVFDEDEDMACPTLNAQTRLIEPDRVNLRIRGRELPLCHRLFANDALVLESPRSRGVCLINAKGRGLRVDYPDYASLGLWTTSAKDAPYLCIEPWNGACDYSDERGVFAEKRGVLRLAPGASRQFLVRVTPLK